MTDPSIRPAVPEEAERISRLAIRSKAHWGYTADQMRVFEDELTIPPERIVGHSCHVLEEGGMLLGFYTLCRRSEAIVELDHLFVDPRHLRRGHGTRLFDHAIVLATQRRYSRLVIQCDPNAEGFYVALGVPLVRQIPSSIPGRSIPYFEMEL